MGRQWHEEPNGQAFVKRDVSGNHVPYPCRVLNIFALCCLELKICARSQFNDTVDVSRLVDR
jgi:hypothetical protein